MSSTRDANGPRVAHPLIAVIGGAKVSTKLPLLEAVLDKADKLIVGGGLANTFLAAAGYPVGKSLFEPNMLESARSLLRRAHARGKDIALPDDVMTSVSQGTRKRAAIRWVSQVGDAEAILDIGPAAIQRFNLLLHSAKTIIWNGPLGAFEQDPFGAGTQAIANEIAHSQAYTLVGGGDTVAAVEKYGVASHIFYLSTESGALLEFLAGKKLPAVEALEERGLLDEVRHAPTSVVH